MTDSLVHRGPDDRGAWVDAPNGVALGHRRLSIVDLSPAGHQPMSSASGRFVMVFNGEVYNHDATRRELNQLGTSFRGTSDTEVIVEACARWPVRDVLPRLNGMFAIALWDRHECELTLVRDRMGIKPLYWAQFGGLFVFGSELKALRAHRGWTPRIRRDALAAFMRHGYVPGPHTIYERVHQLPPGTMLTLRPRSGNSPQITRYWDLKQVADAGLASPFDASDAELVDELQRLLSDAVKLRMIADVPLGAFLSGGVDSSTVAALMQAQSDRPVKTYCIGFGVDHYNEAPHAKAVATHLGTDHTELYVSSDDALRVIPELPHHFDEPFADASQIPTLLVSRLTRQHVTVALSGDGGDELFLGYGRYFANLRLQRRLRHVPPFARRMVGFGLRSLDAQISERWLSALPASVKRALSPSRLRKLAAALDTSDSDALYRDMLSTWASPTELVLSPDEARGRLWDTSLTRGMPSSPAERMQLLDMLTYLPDDILTKVDRASMAVALEARVPLIDYRVVEFAWGLPHRAKLRDGRGKWILRQVLARHVPNHLIDRPKMGFGVPLANWLRGPLRGWAEDLLDESRVKREGLLNASLVRRTWTEHLSGQHNWETHLWFILMFQAWLERWG